LVATLDPVRSISQKFGYAVGDDTGLTFHASRQLDSTDIAILAIPPEAYA
jgi:hypothetical protein